MTNLQHANRGIIPDPPFARFSRDRRIDLRQHVEGCMLGSLARGNAAARDAFAGQLLDRLGKARSRQGLDGVLLSAMTHLAATRHKRLGEAQSLWRATPNSAGEATVVFNASNGEVHAFERATFDPAHDPFAGGVQMSKEVQGINARRGGELMNTCQDGLKALGFAVGAAVGGYFGKSWGTAGSGANVGKNAGEIIGYVVCGDDADAKGAAQEGKAGAGGASGNDGAGNAGGTLGQGGGSQGGSGGTTQQDPISSQPQEEKNQTTDDDDPDKDKDGGGWPNPEEGYPAPDDGGGSPWSVIGIAAMPTATRAMGVFVALSGGGLSAQKTLAAIGTGPDVAHGGLIGGGAFGGLDQHVAVGGLDKMIGGGLIGRNPFGKDVIGKDVIGDAIGNVGKNVGKAPIKGG